MKKFRLLAILAIVLVFPAAVAYAGGGGDDNGGKGHCDQWCPPSETPTATPTQPPVQTPTQTPTATPTAPPVTTPVTGPTPPPDRIDITIVVRAPKACVSKRVASWRVVVLPGHRIKAVRAYFEGVRTTYRRTTYQGGIRYLRGRPMYVVRVPLAGLHTGVFSAQIFYQRSIHGGPFRPSTRNHLYRTCFTDQNPKGGRLPGLNRLPIATV
jgi:hypothetical protein